MVIERIADSKWSRTLRAYWVWVVFGSFLVAIFTWTVVLGSGEYKQTGARRLSNSEAQEALLKAIAAQDDLSIVFAQRDGALIDAPINEVGTLPLGYAIGNQLAVSVSVLLMLGADPNLQSQLPDDFPDMVQKETGLLVSREPMPNLFLAVAKEDVRIVQLLLDYGADPGKTFGGQTALEKAMELGNSELIEALTPIDSSGWQLGIMNQGAQNESNAYEIRSLHKVRNGNLSRYARLAILCRSSSDLGIVVDFNGVFFVKAKDPILGYYVDNRKGKVTEWAANFDHQSVLLWSDKGARIFASEIQDADGLRISISGSEGAELSVSFPVLGLAEFADKNGNLCGLYKG